MSDRFRNNVFTCIGSDHSRSQSKSLSSGWKVFPLGILLISSSFRSGMAESPPWRTRILSATTVAAGNQLNTSYMRTLLKPQAYTKSLPWKRSKRMLSWYFSINSLWNPSLRFIPIALWFPRLMWMEWGQAMCQASKRTLKKVNRSIYIMIR